MKMKPISTEGLLAYVEEHETDYAYMYGENGNKELKCKLNGDFLVYKKNELLLTTKIAEEAVELFNSI